jgi:hypothetical protein
MLETESGKYTKTVFNKRKFKDELFLDGEKWVLKGDLTDDELHKFAEELNSLGKYYPVMRGDIFEEKTKVVTDKDGYSEVVKLPIDLTIPDN